MTREQTEKELRQMPEHVVYLTGDTHGRFDRIEAFCRGREMEQENTFIILGDVGLNYFGDFRDWPGKEQLARLPCTFFCIHGNHEQRPTPLMGYRRSEYHGGAVWVEPQYPNIVFAIDGEVYDFCGHSCLVIGGRLQRGQVVPAGARVSLVAGRAALGRDPAESGNGTGSEKLAGGCGPLTHLPSEV